jgi:hypothetical protein
MAIRHIRDAFNEEAGQHAQCQSATLRYEDNGNGAQHQIITIEVVLASGSTFKLSTPAHKMSDDPHEHVRALARSMIEEPAPPIVNQKENSIIEEPSFDTVHLPNPFDTKKVP